MTVRQLRQLKWSRPRPQTATIPPAEIILQVEEKRIKKYIISPIFEIILKIVWSFQKKALI